jgi:hypothetical protein
LDLFNQTIAKEGPLFQPKALDVRAIVGATSNNIAVADSTELAEYAHAAERRMIDTLALTSKHGAAKRKWKIQLGNCSTDGQASG